MSPRSQLLVAAGTVAVIVLFGAGLLFGTASSSTPADGGDPTLVRPLTMDLDIGPGPTETTLPRRLTAGSGRAE